MSKDANQAAALCSGSVGVNSAEDTVSLEEARIMKRMGSAKAAPVRSPVQANALHVRIEGFIVEEGKPLEIYINNEKIYSRAKPGICSTDLPNYPITDQHRMTGHLEMRIKMQDFFDQELLVDPKLGYLKLVNNKLQIQMAQRSAPFPM
eukprot:CAMPEP_0201522048 /NCGR_PEP_ID=MMETSP0161_2-20130828/16428_1 /ASSEMBLY_ACC=CAM_ASM_000251 /TAXON_ID=180227 /ORGANISM="Neoparamoeba aestuarina, Strain SoJaBio B1-5/56/2" /LENGTH=148 /DNA_ID=CAMNT_0047920801 /DNA_START=70 /DNA_END=516 /DNA_ORIENTATION=+